MQTQPKPGGDPDDWSADALQEIEGVFPPRRFSLAEYRSHLQSLESDLRNRISQLDEEIG